MKTKKTEKKKTKKKQPILFYKILSFILIILSIATIGVVIYNELLPLPFMIPILVVGFIILFVLSFILNKNKLKAWIKNVVSGISILLIIFEILLLIFDTKTLKFLSNITDTGYRVESYGVYVLKESSYKKLEDLDGKKITYLNHSDDKNIREALKIIRKKVKVTDDYEDTLNELLDTLINGETDAILMEISYEDLIRDEMESESEKIRRIDTVDVVDVVSVIDNDVDITKDPFIVYISGIDTSGHVASKARSDVNILLAVNPKTKNILMVNTPRDYHVTLASKGKKDKLTHAGIYGVEESVKTLNDLYDIDINYYARINFTSFVKIVDSLGGIKVKVPKSFCEQNSKRSFKNGDLICLKPGVQNLNGEQALALARHRKTIGDRKRGENQMLVLEATLNKAMSPKIITKYSSILSALNDKVSTNMTKDEIIKFVKKQMKNDYNWNYSSISANGKNARGKCYSTGNANLSIIEPDYETVEEVKQALNNLLNGEEKVIPEKTTTTTTKTTKK